MAANPYPNIGWNPVPGIPAEVMKLQQKVAAAAAALENTHRQLTKLTGESSYWEGDAAEKFRDALDGDLPKYIKDAASSLRAAATHLHQWDGHLTSNRELAKKYDAAMAEKKAAADKAKNSYDQAARHPDLKLANQTFPSQEEADAATARLRSAERELNEASEALSKANGEYESLDGKVKVLEAEHTSEAETIAKALDGSTKSAPDEPGFWDKVGDVISGVWEFLKTHAGTIGAVAGLLALLPTPFAPLFAGIAIAASALSMYKNLSDADFLGDLIGQDGGMDMFSAWASVGGDILGMVPGARLVGMAGKELRDGLQMASEMGVQVSRWEKTVEFGREFGGLYRNAAREGSYGMWEAAGQSFKGSAQLMGDLTANGLNVAANLVTSMEEEGHLPDEGASHNAAEDTKAGVGAYGIARLRGLL
ncbi:putative T7SS-secreted protein [Streptomyces chartreusis]